MKSAHHLPACLPGESEARSVGLLGPWVLLACKGRRLVAWGTAFACAARNSTGATGCNRPSELALHGCVPAGLWAVLLVGPVALARRPAPVGLVAALRRIHVLAVHAKSGTRE